MLSSEANVIIWAEMLSFGANVLMVSSGANVIIWCYHVMLSPGMITHPLFIFPENWDAMLSFYKFCGLLVSRKENICISLVLVAHF